MTTDVKISEVDLSQYKVSGHFVIRKDASVDKPSPAFSIGEVFAYAAEMKAKAEESAKQEKTKSDPVPEEVLQQVVYWSRAFGKTEAYCETAFRLLRRAREVLRVEENKNAKKYFDPVTELGKDIDRALGVYDKHKSESTQPPAVIPS
jgi:hypothetical protein